MDDAAAAATSNNSEKIMTLTGDTTATASAIPANVTFNLNGHALTATSVNSFGDIKDSSGGDGIIKIAQNTNNDNKLILSAGNTMLPLYDTVDGGYRFFVFDLVNKGQKQGTTTEPDDTNVMRYGVQLSFDSIKAYELMAAGNLDVDLYMNLTTTEGKLGENGIDYHFNPDTLKTYGAECVKDFDDKEALERNTIVLRVTGMESLNGDTLHVNAALNTITDKIPSVDVVAK